MKKSILGIIAAAALLNSLQAQQILFSENFGSMTLASGTYGFIPAGMIGINADGFPANTNGNPPFNLNGYLNLAAAVGYTDPMGTDTAAIMTSSLNPPGQADRWLISPPISGITANTMMSWESKAYAAAMADGYEVWVSAAAGNSSNPVVSDFTALSSNRVFDLAAENNTFTSHMVSLSAFAGQTVRFAFRNDSYDKLRLFIDDILVFSPFADDIWLTAVAPTGYDVWGAVNTGKTISGTVVNNGYSPINSFTAKYSDGNVVSQTFSNLNLAYGQSYNFTFSVPYTIASADQSVMNIWVEISNDANNANDTLSTHINGTSFVPNHKVVFEESTGTWCGWCVRGTVYMDSIHQVHPSTTELIACHNFDVMSVTPYSDSMSYILYAYPSIWGERGEIDLPDSIFSIYNSHINHFAFADLNVTANFNPVTRVVNVDVATTPASTINTNNSAENDFRLCVAYTEMNVTGTTPDYDQANYYSYQAYNLPLSGAGHDWQSEPDPVPAANMHYDFVAREFSGGFRGLANSLPDTLIAGTTCHNTSFTYTVPAAYNAANMRAIAILFDTKNGVIYNANGAPFTTPSGISSAEGTNTNDFLLYPNPGSDLVNLGLSLNEEGNVRIDVYNSLGELVYSETKQNLAAGQHRIELNAGNWANGLYSVTVSTAGGTTMRKLTVQH